MTADPSRLGIFLPRRQWLYVHIVAGAVALLIGPVQLWFGLNRRHMLLHRVLGVGYVLAVACGGTAAFYLALHTDYGWVFGMGLMAMALAWTTSTALAVVAISKRLIEQHKEWMIRSYIVTFAFVTFRILVEAFEVIGVGNTVERLTAASWVSWAVPLLIAETILQGRKIFEARKPSRVYLLGVGTSVIRTSNESVPTADFEEIVPGS